MNTRKIEDFFIYLNSKLEKSITINNSQILYIDEKFKINEDFRSKYQLNIIFDKSRLCFNYIVKGNVANKSCSAGYKKLTGKQIDKILNNINNK